MFSLFYSLYLILLFLSAWLCSSFNDKPVNEEAVGPMGRELFEMEQGDLLADLVDIPKKACDRRVRLYGSHFTVFFFFGGI